jgi:uncharacterized protein YjbJ (UPF0337 family)
MSGGFTSCSKNERTGNVEQAKGRVRQAVATLTGNDKSNG